MLMRYGSLDFLINDLDLFLLRNGIICWKIQADKHRRNVSWNVSDRGYPRLRPYKMTSLAKRSNEKFSPRFLGPYRNLEKVGVFADGLEFPP